MSNISKIFLVCIRNTLSNRYHLNAIGSIRRTQRIRRTQFVCQNQLDTYDIVLSCLIICSQRFAMADHGIIILNHDRDYIIQTRFNFRTEYVFIQNLDLDTYLKSCKY